MRFNSKYLRTSLFPGLVFLIVLTWSSSAFAQGSIFGGVSNSDASTPTNGEISFVGFLDDTDEEIRIETSDGAGYDNGNWFDDFQNYLTEAPFNPYDYYFYNVVNGEGYHLSGLIPNNSFQQEDVTLAPDGWPAMPVGLTGSALSSSRVLVEWNGVPGLTYHVYRRLSSSNGSFFRLDNAAGDLADPGVTDSFFVDNTVDGVSSYDYFIIAENASAGYSPHSALIVINSASPVAPAIASVDPDNGPAVGGTPFNVYGSGFDPGGVSVQIGTSTPVAGTVISPYHVTATTAPGTIGAADVTVTNDASSLISNALAGAFTYNANAVPVLAAIGPESIDEGQLLSFGVSASDPDGTIPVLTTSAPPTGASFTDNLDGTGTFTWTPDFTQSGDYFVTFYATDDSLAVDSEIVTITVNHVNLAPVLAAIGGRTVDEGQPLTIGVATTDADGTIPVLTTSALPTGATFTDNLDGTGTFNWTPDFTQSRDHFVTFYATDDSAAADSEIVTITVNQVNLAPVLAAIGAKAVAEDQLLTFGVSATDADGTIPVLTTSTLPTGATFTDNLDGTGTFNWTPDFTQSRDHFVTFYATDDSAVVDSEVVTITVGQVNVPPVLAAIGARTIDEGQILAFGVSATDADGIIPVLTTSALPTGASFTDNLDGTGTFSWTPDYSQSGDHFVTFYATDDSAAVDSEIVTITVNQVNLPPELAVIGAQVVDEGQLLTFGVSATDPDATIPVLTTSTLPAGALFADNLDGTGTFSWTPDFTQSGPYDITFYATDDSLVVDSELVIVTVNHVNLPPELALIGPQAVAEGELLAFVTSASDPDGDIPVMTSTALPGTATYIDNGDGTGAFNWQTTFADSGSYTVTFYATDAVDPLAVDSEVVTISIGEVGNHSPVLTPIADTTVAEGSNLAFTVTASDSDLEIPSLSASGLPANATFTDNLDGTGLFDFNPDLTQSGVYPVVFKAVDAALEVDSAVVQITVTETNQLPVLAAIGPRTVLENDTLRFLVSATDGDGTVPLLTTGVLPAGAVFTDSLNGSGLFEWVPDFTQAAPYDVMFYATDAVYATDIDSELVVVTVDEAGNQPPVLAAIGPQTVAEGDSLILTITATDPDGIPPTMLALDVPANATFLDNGDGTGLFEFGPDFYQSGPYSVTFIADDGLLADSEVVDITVNEVGNVPPVFDPIADTTVAEGATLVMTVSAVDPDGGTIFPALSVSTALNNYTFVDNHDGTGAFTYSPDFVSAGADSVFFFAVDYGTPQQSSSVGIEITTADVNQPPVWAEAGPFGVSIGETLVFTVSASDTTDPITIHRLFLSVLSTPPNASFADNADGTGTFTFAPDASQAGLLTVTFLAVDLGIPMQSASLAVDITVAVENIPPILDSIGPQTVVEGDILLVNVSAADPDGPPPQLLADKMPNNSSFDDNGDGTGVFTFFPNYVQAGLASVTIKAYDGFAIDKEVILIQIYEAGDQAPVFDSVPSASVTEGETATLVITAYDPDEIGVSLSADDATMPEFASFSDDGGGVGTFTLTPLFADAGTYPIDVIADDGSMADTVTVTVTVIEAGNQHPFLDPITAEQTIPEKATVAFTVTAYDLDETFPILSTSLLPANATFTDNNDGSGDFSFTPDFDQEGVHEITFYATDNIETDSALVTITVTDNNQLPFVYPTGGRTLYEGDTLIYEVTSFDADGSTPFVDAFLSGTADSLPPNMTFVDNRDLTGTLTFMPDYLQGGPASNPELYNIVFSVADERYPTVIQTSGTVTFQVIDRNAPPEIALPDGPGPYSVTEGATLSFTVGATDLDSSMDPLIFATDIPPNATFEGTSSIKEFVFTPDYTQAGTYFVTFWAYDDDGDLDTEVVQIDVLEAGNQAPVFTSVLEEFRNVPVNTLSQIVVTAVDPDLDPVILTAEPIWVNMYASFVDAGNGTGTYSVMPDPLDVDSVYPVSFVVTDPSGLTDTITTSLRVVTVLRGDLDDNSTYTMNDLAWLIAYLFRDGPVPATVEAADVDGDGDVNVGDVTYLIKFLYYYGPAPPN